MIDQFKNRVKHARKVRGLSQAELASRLGWNTSAVGHYETGERKPGLDNLKELCDALSVSGDYLLGLTSDMSQSSSSIFKNLDRLTSDEIDFVQTVIDAKVGQR